MTNSKNVMPSETLNRDLLEKRKDSVRHAGCGAKKEITCDTQSVAGAVSQRACVYCGARVVLNPITDAFHIVHGPIGCASYTWDIRGSLSRSRLSRCRWRRSRRSNLASWRPWLRAGIRGRRPPRSRSRAPRRSSVSRNSRSKSRANMPRPTSMKRASRAAMPLRSPPILR